jgi:hypothetical protein
MVVALIVAGFMASLNVAVMTAFGQAPWLPLSGTTEIKVGGVVPLTFGVQHPTATTATSAARKRLVEWKTEGKDLGARMITLPLNARLP